MMTLGQGRNPDTGQRRSAPDAGRSAASLRTVDTTTYARRGSACAGRRRPAACARHTWGNVSSPRRRENLKPGGSGRLPPRRRRFPDLVALVRLVPAIGGDDGKDHEHAGQGEQHGGGGLEDQHGSVPPTGKR